ncbi:hypothetical protein L596_012436 [Steinernema carpocapsae]|uniref:Uncharacterized protein n=1 Tax=Steinernema carpocapsae TaxID=34508 RepID=A0A4U5NX62_STECR|nr:hypothetical protein L596_012436 [Steinernema carpocapsae]
MPLLSTIRGYFFGESKNYKVVPSSSSTASRRERIVSAPTNAIRRAKSEHRRNLTYVEGSDVTSTLPPKQPKRRVSQDPRRRWSTYDRSSYAFGSGLYLDTSLPPFAETESDPRTSSCDDEDDELNREVFHPATSAIVFSTAVVYPRSSSNYYTEVRVPPFTRV